jgi:hypothetical protein
MNNLECFIDFDDEWIQEDCHWKYDRIFTITYKIANDFSFGNNIPEFYYSVGTTEYRVEETTDDTYTEGKLFHKAGTRTWTFELRLSSISNEVLLAARTSDGWLDVAARLSVKDTSGVIHQAATVYVDQNIKEINPEYTSGYLLELAPKHPIENLKTEVVINNPGELKCSWNKATTIDDNAADSVDGYTVEMKHCLADNDHTKEENYFYVENLAWDSEALKEGKYKLIRTAETPIDVNVPEAEEGEEEIITFVSDLINTEVYIDGANNNQFYFEPKQLGLDKGDYYKFIIYPYSHYFSENTLIMPDGTESNTREVPNGIFHVFNGTHWVEGVVYVMVYDEVERKNVWKIADSIYVMTEDDQGNKSWQITA